MSPAGSAGPASMNDRSSNQENSRNHKEQKHNG
jgi:hypothetical protein